MEYEIIKRIIPQPDGLLTLEIYDHDIPTNTTTLEVTYTDLQEIILEPVKVKFKDHWYFASIGPEPMLIDCYPPPYLGDQ